MVVYLTVKEYARMMRLHTHSVYRMIKEGRLRAVRSSIRGAIRIPFHEEREERPKNDE